MCQLPRKLTVSGKKWIGRAEVSRKPGCDVLSPGSAGAIVIIIAAAKGKDDFMRVAREAFAEYGLELVTLKDAERLDVHVLSHLVSSLPYLTLSNSLPEARTSACMASSRRAGKPCMWHRSSMEAGS